MREFSVVQQTGGSAAPTPDQLDASEMAYHRHVWAQRQIADARAAIAKAVMDSWWEHLREKYEMNESDMLNAEGVITRASVAPPTVGDTPAAETPA